MFRQTSVNKRVKRRNWEERKNERGYKTLQFWDKEKSVFIDVKFGTDQEGID